MSTLQNNPQRVYWIDVARGLAILSITCCHAATRSFAIYEGTLLEFQSHSLVFSILKACLYIFSRLGVPLFLMITGALMLPRDYERKGAVEKLYQNNWLPILRTTVIWFGIMYLYLSLFHDSVLRTQGVGKGILKFFETLLFVNQQSFASMWYMPMILSLYLLLPIMAVGLQHFGDKYFYALSGLAVLLAMVLPNFNALFAHLGTEFRLYSSLSVGNLFSVFWVYLFFGYWVRRGKLDRLSDGGVLAGVFLSFAATVAFQVWVYSGPTDYDVQYQDIGILLTALFLFELLRRKGEEFRGLEKPVLSLSACAFGIFFLHICLMHGLNQVLKHVGDVPYFSRFFLLEVLSFGGSWLLVSLTSRWKFFRKYLYMMEK
ncbi:MAG: acyltransferase [Clostridia bacterium]|nr:acyltransferase [Clostridia bacterium]